MSAAYVEAVACVLNWPDKSLAIIKKNVERAGTPLDPYVNEDVRNLQQGQLTESELPNPWLTFKIKLFDENDCNLNKQNV
ncbi:hypothetical protein CWM47_21210 [Spirosoma pollinicola]|uniref:Uncharacterized protein n=1 Tax=Spirosoma pollinicola TaxID=2057025 RepID=A0A2K8Z2M9_9BACT|nr:hypothetical protein CWM47_21210 [Spirosoma pollinicola]